MKYKMGMSDKRTRAKASKRYVPKVSSNYLKAGNGGMKRGKVSHSKISTKGSYTKAASKYRSGFRKFSKLGVTTLGISSMGNKRRSNGSSPTSSSVSRKAKVKKVFKKAAFATGGIALAVAMISSIGMGLYLKNLENSLPDPNKLIERSSDQSTILYDRNGEELFKIYGDENRQFVSIDDIPDHTKWALLAAEDVEFYQHKGLDWKGITRCGFLSLQSYFSGGNSGALCGASTITQQLVRNTLMYDVFGDEAFERSTFLKTVRRKLRELLLSMQVERTLSKDEILQLYMNEINLGGVNYGYGAAAQSYFNKNVDELTIAESAMLAGIIQQPSILSPLYGVNPEGAPARQKYVLDQMEKHKSLTGITDEELETARAEELVYSSGNIDIEAYHFVFYIKQYLEEQYGAEVVERGGLKVTTTLDLSTQKIAQEEITNGIASIGNRLGVYNGAMVVVDPNTGQILAMVGSVDPNKTDDPRIDGNVNITTSLRQMGSSFKPYVYLTAFEKMGPWFEAPDIPMNFGNYKPDNWDDRFHGLMTAREALIKSRNIPAIYTLQMVGIDAAIQTAEKAGVTTLTNTADYGLSLALGAAEMKLLEHAQGFSVFATGGVRRDVTGVLKIEDAKGEVIYEYQQTEGQRVFDEKDVYMLNWVLCDLGGFGDQPMNNQYVLSGKRTLCGKTGTTNGPKDLVSMMYHKNLVVGIWAGNNNGEEVPGAWSTTVPLPIAHSFMERVATKYVPELPTRPGGIVAGSVCNDTGRMASAENKCKKVSTVYVQGRAPKADSRESFFLCKVNNKVPSNLEEAQTIKEADGSYSLLKEVSLLNFEMDNPAQQASFQKYFTENGEIFLAKPESAVCDVPLGPDNAPLITLLSPTQGTTFKPGDKITFTARTRSKGDIKHVQYSFAGSVVSGKLKNSPYEFTYTVPDSIASGNAVITATVVDDQDKSSSTSISVTINNPNASQKKIKIEWPSSGTTVNKPVNIELKARVSGFFPTNLTFSVTGPNGYSWQSGGSNNGEVWTAQWNANNAPTGDYTILATSEGASDGVTVVVK